ncbi:MAG: hypothetical protein C5B49_12245 [Bdellovibrio sp.]|nr:MAG: hypothetical protein C5B49_12245 [Bdellovibrio sp.]
MSQAQAAANEGINIMLGFTDPNNHSSVDQIDLAALKAANIYGVAGVNATLDLQSFATLSAWVQDVEAKAQAAGASTNLIGYNIGDEPGCPSGNTPLATDIPSLVSQVKSVDPTRLILNNFTAWMTEPTGWLGGGTCPSDLMTALQSVSVGSFDIYPATSPYTPQGMLVSGMGTFAISDFQSVSNDIIWLQGIEVQKLRADVLSTEPTWVYIESGSDNLGFSAAANSLNATITSGSNVLINGINFSKFTSTWVGLTVSGSGIPNGTTITSITDSTHAVMSGNATSSATESVTITGGVNDSGCVAAQNICVVNGNEYRPTPAEVNSEVWMSLINGANGSSTFVMTCTRLPLFGRSEHYRCFGISGGGGKFKIHQSNHLEFCTATQWRHRRNLLHARPKPIKLRFQHVDILQSGDFDHDNK